MAQMVCMPILYARPLYIVANLTLILNSTLKRGNSHLYPIRQAFFSIRPIQSTILVEVSVKDPEDFVSDL